MGVTILKADGVTKVLEKNVMVLYEEEPGISRYIFDEEVSIHSGQTLILGPIFAEEK